MAAANNNIITGQTGPFSLSTPGSYGRNSAHNAQQANPSSVASATIVFTPPTSFSPDGSLSRNGLNDYFGYAEEDLKLFDLNGDMIVDDAELAQAFGGDSERANLFMTAVNQDGEAGLSVVDMTGYLIAQDAPKQLFDGLGYDALFQDTSNPMAFDGQTTPAERAALDSLIYGTGTAPGRTAVTDNQVAGEGMAGLQEALNLKENYAQYQVATGQPALGGQPAPLSREEVAELIKLLTELFSSMDTNTPVQV